TTNLTRLYANNNAYFKPQKVHTNPFKLMLGSAFVGGVTTSDHNSTVKTATFMSITNYLDKFDLLYKSVNLEITGKLTSNI
ncbi:MAG: hypothetical protein ACI9ES_003535, partial [Oceanospirillaceae bacterium]